jgi:hypothetical protein
VNDAIFTEVGNERLCNSRIVVAVIQGSGPGKKIDKAIALLIKQIGSFGLVKNSRKGTGVAAYVRLNLFENFHDNSQNDDPQKRKELK